MSLNLMGVLKDVISAFEEVNPTPLVILGVSAVGCLLYDRFWTTTNIQNNSNSTTQSKPSLPRSDSAPELFTIPEGDEGDGEDKKPLLDIALEPSSKQGRKYK